MSAKAKRNSVLITWSVLLLALLLLVFWDIASSVAQKMLLEGKDVPYAWGQIFGESKIPDYLLDPVYKKSNAMIGVPLVGICASNEPELSATHDLDDTPLTISEVDEIVRLAVQRAGGFDDIVKPGDWVVIKPNMFGAYGLDAFGYVYNLGVEADLRVVLSLIVQLMEQGRASRITVAEGGTWHNI